MEFKGTKGKWYSKYSKTDEGFKISSGIDLVCITRCIQREDEANALLISKAPEMLQMLKDIRNQIEDGRTYITKDDIDRLIKQETEI